MPRNGRNYVALSSKSFCHFICSSIETVHDCYILHAKNFIITLNCFDVKEGIEVISESNEDDFPDVT